MSSAASTVPAPPASSWKRTLWVMATVQFVMMVAFSSGGPFLPLFVEQLGVHDMRQVSIWAGVIQSANFLFSALISPLWGALADTKGRKLMVLRSTFAITLFTFFMGLAQNVWQLLLIRALQARLRARCWAAWARRRLASARCSASQRCCTSRTCSGCGGAWWSRKNCRSSKTHGLRAVSFFLLHEGGANAGI